MDFYYMTTCIEEDFDEDEINNLIETLDIIGYISIILYNLV